MEAQIIFIQKYLLNFFVFHPKALCALPSRQKK